MNPLVKFFQIPLVKLVTHVVLVVGLVVNVYNLYSWYRVGSKVDQNQKILSALTQQNSESKSDLGYYSSSIYKEKYAKSSGYKNQNEDVVDTSLAETNDFKVVNYIPTKNQRTTSNPEKWFICFFGDIESTTTQNTKTDSVSAECRR
jgi:cell division protein FtsL